MLTIRTACFLKSWPWCGNSPPGGDQNTYGLCHEFQEWSHGCQVRYHILHLATHQLIYRDRKFWRENLPRLKYHNPAVPMIVNRHNQNQKKPTLSIYLRKPDASTPAPETRSQPASSRSNLSKATPPDADEKIITVDMTEKHSSHILEFVLAETRAVPLKPTKEEIRELQEIDAMARQAEVDRARMRGLREEKQREEDMLKRARAAGGVVEEEDS